MSDTAQMPPAALAAASPRAGSTLKALAWMLGALASFSLIAIAGREAARTSDTMQIMFYRSVIALILVLVVARLSGWDFKRFHTERLPLHGIRSAIHFIAQFSWLHALTLIPLAQLFALEFTAPLWVALLAPLLLREKLTASRVSAALIGFVGLLIVVRPGVDGLNLGTALGLIAAVGFAFSMITTKQLTRTDAPLTILFYMSLMQALMALIPALPRLTFPDASSWFWLFLVAACGLTAHFSLARAFAEADAMIVAPMDFFRLPLIAVAGVFLYAEPLDPFVLIGGAIVMAANVLNLWGERRRSRTTGT